MWRRQVGHSNIEIAAYAYDSGIKPYNSGDPNLLQVFDMSLTIGVTYRLSLYVEPSQTTYTLSELNEGGTAETKVVTHNNACLNAA